MTIMILYREFCCASWSQSESERRELQRLWNTKETVISNLIVAFGTVPKIDVCSATALHRHLYHYNSNRSMSVALHLKF